MQSLSAGIRLLQRQRVDSSKIAHFSSIGAHPFRGGSGFSSLASDRLASAKLFGVGSAKGSLFQSLSKCSYQSWYQSWAAFAKMGSQTETLTCSGNAMLFKSPQPGLFRWAAGSPPFPSRCMTTVGNTVESATQDSTISESDVPPRIKFKRLDKTAKHIMQMFVWSAESSSMEMDSLERLRSFMIAFADVRKYTIPSMRLSVISMHTKSDSLETHKQYLMGVMALDVIKVKAPIDVIAVTKLRREGWMGRIQVVAWPYSPDNKQIQTSAYIHAFQ